MPRLDILVARNVGCSRAAARAAIADGRLAIDGTVLDDSRRELGDDALPARALLDGEPLVLHDRVRLMLNKPAGCVSALRDDHHPTAYALLRGAPLVAELRPVGRLDADTTGLLLWSNDGAEIQRLTHPKRAVPRVYQAALARPFGVWTGDLVLDDGYRPRIEALVAMPAEEAHPSLLIPPQTSALARITVTGGAYHEVRRVFAALGSHVLGLCRVAFGERELPPDLPPGAYRLC